MKALFFDIGGVLLTNAWDTGERSEAAARFSFDSGEAEKRHVLHFEALERGEISLDDYLSRVYFFKKRNFTRRSFVRFMESCSKPFPENLKILKKLAARKKYFMAALNNESAGMNAYRIRRYGLDSAFSAFFSSCYLGCRKPSPEIFEKTLAMTRFRPQECLFIDDRPENVKAARRFGFRTVTVQRPGELAAGLAAAGIPAR